MSDRGAPPDAALPARGILGGVLMGLANLVPGISGGTMLLASGVYRGFVEGVAEITTLRFRTRSLILLASIGVAAALTILLLAGPIKSVVGSHRWVMYSVFIGLTLGGVPLVWRLARGVSLPLILGALAGFLAMVGLALAQSATGGDSGWPILLVAGVAGAAAMILPGVSGAYLLLVLGQYETILGAIDRVKTGLKGDFSQIWEAMGVLTPVAIGVLIGVVGISNLVRWTMARFEKATLGVLLGLLLGSVVGIWPFQLAVSPGQPRIFYTPSGAQVLAALLLVGLGLAITWLIDRVGRRAGREVA
jgi:putative membrane protein